MQKNHLNTDKEILISDIICVLTAVLAIYIEYLSRGLSIYFSTTMAAIYTGLSLYQERQPTRSKRLEHILNLTRILLITNLTVTLVGHTHEDTYKYLILPLSLVLLVKSNRQKVFSLCKSSLTILLIAGYCYWVGLSGILNNVQNTDQLEFYSIIGILSVLSATLLANGSKEQTIKALAYTLAIAVILTTYQRGIETTEDPPGLIITYKNLSAFIGILAICILFCLKPKDLLSTINSIILGLTALAVILTPSAAGKLSLLVIVSFIILLYCYRHFQNHKYQKTIQKSLIYLTSLLFISSIILVPIYYKEISLLMGKKETLGGRTKIWESSFDWVKSSPVTGNGGAFWGNQGGSAAGNHHHEYVNRGYNGFLDVLVQYGTTGLLLLIAILFLAVKETKLRWGEKTLLLLATILSLLTESHSLAGSFLIKGETTARAILIFWLAFCLSQNKSIYIEMIKDTQNKTKDI